MRSYGLRSRRPSRPDLVHWRGPGPWGPSVRPLRRCANWMKVRLRTHYRSGTARSVPRHERIRPRVAPSVAHRPSSGRRDPAPPRRVRTGISDGAGPGRTHGTSGHDLSGRRGQGIYGASSGIAVRVDNHARVECAGSSRRGGIPGRVSDRRPRQRPAAGSGPDRKSLVALPDRCRGGAGWPVVRGRRRLPQPGRPLDRRQRRDPRGDRPDRHRDGPDHLAVRPLQPGRFGNRVPPHPGRRLSAREREHRRGRHRELPGARDQPGEADRPPVGQDRRVHARRTRDVRPPQRGHAAPGRGDPHHRDHRLARGAAGR